MFRFVLAVVSIALLTGVESTPAPGVGSRFDVGLAVGVAIFLVLLPPIAVFLLTQRLTRAVPLEPSRWIARAERVQAVLPLAGFTALLYATDWYWLTHSWIPVSVPLVARLLAFAPYFLGYAAATTVVATRLLPLCAPGTTLTSLIGFDLRPFVVVGLPYALFTGLFELSWLSVPLREALNTDLLTATSALSAAMLLLLGLAPFFFRSLWPSQALPAGELRDRIAAACRRAGCASPHVRVWNTGSYRSIDARVVGLGPSRTVFLSDTLIEILSPSELEQVFAHELGHVRRRHLTLYFLVVWAIVLALAGGERYLPSSPGLAWAAIAAIALVYFGVFFGALSRHFESEADLFAADNTGSAAEFAATLEKVGDVTGSRHRKGWRHPSIEDRLESVWKGTTTPSARARLVARGRAWRTAVAAVTLSAAALFAFEVHTLQERDPTIGAVERAHFWLDDYALHRFRPAHHDRALERADEILAGLDAADARVQPLRERRDELRAR